MSLLFPRACFGCGLAESYLCPSCIRSWTPQSWRLDDGTRVIALARYRDRGVERAIKQLKYRGSRDVAQELAIILFETITSQTQYPRSLRSQSQGGKSQRGDLCYQRSPLWVDKLWINSSFQQFIHPKVSPLGTLLGNWGVVSIPITKKRHRERGFNQAELIGQAFARELGISFIPALEKIRETLSQSTLKRQARLENMNGAFRARAGIAIPDRVIVVDDVSTTGATLAEAARALTVAGATTIIGAVIAHD